MKCKIEICRLKVGPQGAQGLCWRHYQKTPRGKRFIIWWAKKQEESYTQFYRDRTKSLLILNKK